VSLEKFKIAHDRQNSLLYWFPKICNLNIPVPRTEWVLVEGDLLQYLYSEKELPRELRNELIACGRKIGYPLFLRTDNLSGKHDWERTCYVQTENDLVEHVYALIETSACADIIGLDINAFVFREFLQLDWKFKAFEGMPVARERRYFIKDGKVLCHHPYWIEDAIAKGWHKYPLPNNWKKVLKELNKETRREVKTLTDCAAKVAKVMGGFWSVDFACSKSGKWYLIDMARGEASWHPDCRYVTPDEL